MSEWTSNHMPSKVCDETDHPFPNLTQWLQRWILDDGWIISSHTLQWMQLLIHDVIEVNLCYWNGIRSLIWHFVSKYARIGNHTLLRIQGSSEDQDSSAAIIMFNLLSLLGGNETPKCAVGWTLEIRNMTINPRQQYDQRPIWLILK